MGNVHVSDVGTELIINMLVSLASATAGFPKVRLKKPSGVYLQRLASDLLILTVTDSPNGIARLIFTTGELDESGVWTGETKMSYNDGTTFTGDSFTFSIVANLT